MTKKPAVLPFSLETMGHNIATEGDIAKTAFESPICTEQYYQALHKNGLCE